MAGKTVVKGKQANAFYKRLGEITGSKPKWNFHKYLINRDGSLVIDIWFARKSCTARANQDSYVPLRYLVIMFHRMCSNSP